MVSGHHLTGSVLEVDLPLPGFIRSTRTWNTGDWCCGAGSWQMVLVTNHNDRMLWLNASRYEWMTDLCMLQLLSYMPLSAWINTIHCLSVYVCLCQCVIVCVSVCRYCLKVSCKCLSVNALPLWSQCIVTWRRLCLTCVLTPTRDVRTRRHWLRERCMTLISLWRPPRQRNSRHVWPDHPRCRLCHTSQLYINRVATSDLFWQLLVL